jgi:ATP-dependent Clp protease ATP-binding subunit ClpA
LQDKGVTLDVEDSAREWLAEHGFDPKMGARPMARVIQEHIKKPLAEELLFGRLANGGHLVIRAEDAQLLHEIREEEEIS